MKAKIQSVHFTADQKLIDFINHKLEKLTRLSENIIDISVILKLENTGKIKDKVGELIVQVPGNQLIASSTSKTFEQSVDESIEAVSRQLKKIKGKKADVYKSARAAR